VFKLIPNFLSPVTPSGNFPILRRGISWMNTHEYHSVFYAFLFVAWKRFSFIT
jgi:hypothetical protein